MDISINGARILWTIEGVPLLGRINITQTMIVSWLVMAIITVLCIWLGSGLKVTGISRKQAVAEIAVTSLVKFVRNNMGTEFDRYIPLVGTIFISSIVSNLISIFGTGMGVGGVCSDHLPQNQGSRLGRLFQGLFGSYFCNGAN